MKKELQVLDEKDFDIDIEATQASIALKVQNSPEIIKIATEVSMDNAQSILKFGESTAVEITKFADEILENMKMTKVEDSGVLLAQLNKIMDKFDVKDFDDKAPGFFEKIINRAKDSVDAILKKYGTMGGEVDKVYQQLTIYEKEIEHSNHMLDGMFERNMAYYESLQQYIYAGQMVLDQVKTVDLPALQDKAASQENQLDQIDLNNMHQAIEMLEHRLYDLELAKNVSLQTLPQIKLIQKGNYNLVRKINSAFIVTLPIFKQGLTQAIALKRQNIQAKAMQALDEKTNELLLRNAENTAMQAKLTAQLSAGSSIDVETLQATWKTIVDGIAETKRIQDEANLKRIEGVKILHAIQDEFHSKTKLG